MFHRLTAQDHRLIEALARRRTSPVLARGFRLVTHAGGATATVSCSLLLMLFPATRHLGCVTGVANLVSHLFVQTLKRAVVRARPTTVQPHVTPLAGIPDHFSFPSGHACAAMAIAVPTLLAVPSAGFPLLALALAVGASRVYLRVHYATDVLVGQLLGAGAGVLAHLALP